NTYNVDLTQVYSTSSLAINIFRVNFLNKEIPLIPRSVESDIRSGFRGGSVQLFHTIGTNLHYYDINSLYPFSMSSAIPYQYLGRVPGKYISPNTFFGFINATIYPPQQSKTPIVIPSLDPNTGRVIYPSKPFSGFFFSRELAYAISLGYRVVIHWGYEFSTT